MPRKKIMVVDDEENLLFLLNKILESEGFDVITADNGRECLELLKKEKPDMILLDMMMPGITGIDVAEAIRSNPKTRNMKIIFLTVVKSNEIRKDRLKKIKALDYIEKPFDNKDLVRRVKKIVC
jgi:CheY-like chemotaxis protein